MAPERTPLDKDQLRAELKVYEVWVTVNRELAEILVRLPMFRDENNLGARSFKVATHRVGPMKLFDIPAGSRFPTEYEREQADDESQRLAQRTALTWLRQPGVRLAVVTWRRRKEASGRFTRGPAESWPVARMRDEADSWIYGEPSQKALDIDEGRL